MPLAFVLDDHLRGDVWVAVRGHNATSPLVIDVTRVGDPPDLPLGTADPDILIWAEANDRIVVSRDFKTMPGYFIAHLAAGRRSPGLALLKPSASVAEVVAYLALAAHVCDPYEFADATRVIPEP